MDSIDVLGEHFKMPAVISKDLLAETDDEELQKIVENAAAELNSPIALVSLILDQIQFFKAHIGLPEVLASARGTHRDVSFCQFVVRDGKTFEVNDGPNDTRIPQHVVKEYNIQAYLGVPIKVDGLVVGSLCVLDIKKRGFTKAEHKSLNELAALVNKRLEVITNSRRQARLDLTYSALHPALAEMSDALRPIQEHINLGYSYIASIRSFLDLTAYLYKDKVLNSDTAGMSFEAANEANQMLHEHFLEIEMGILDSMDCLNALNNLVSGSTGARLSEIVTSAQDLARNATKLIGGFRLPDFTSDPIIHTKGDLAIALVSNCLLMISSELKKTGIANGIQLHVDEYSGIVELKFTAKGLNDAAFDSVSSHLNLLIGGKHPTVSLNTLGSGIRLIFRACLNFVHTEDQ